jgi:hypothetical protein
VSKSIKIKLTNSRGPIKLANANFAYVASPASRPTIISSAITDLTNYSNTALMLANDATTYANAVNYVEGKNFVNTSQLAANLANFTPATNLQVSSLTDVVATSPSNNATLVYNTDNNKYTVKQLDLDGGNF